MVAKPRNTGQDWEPGDLTQTRASTPTPTTPTIPGLSVPKPKAVVTTPSLKPVARPVGPTTNVVGGKLKAPVRNVPKADLSAGERALNEGKAIGQMALMFGPALVGFGYGLVKDSAEVFQERAAGLVPGWDYKATPESYDQLVNSFKTTFTNNPFRRYKEAWDAGYAITPFILEDIGNVSMVGYGFKAAGKAAGISAGSISANAAAAGNAAKAAKYANVADRATAFAEQAGRFATATDKLAAAPIVGAFKGVGAVGQEFRTGAIGTKFLPERALYGDAAYQNSIKQIYELRETEPDISPDDPRIVRLQRRANRAWRASNSFSLRSWIRRAVKYERNEADVIQRTLLDVTENPLYKDEFGPLTEHEQAAIISVFNGTASMIKWFMDNSSMTPEKIATIGRYDYLKDFSLTPDGARLAVVFLDPEGSGIDPRQIERLQNAAEALQDAVRQSTQRAIEGFGRRAAMSEEYLVPTPLSRNLEANLIKFGDQELLDAWESVKESGVLDLPVNDRMRMETLQSFVRALPDDLALDASMYPASMRPLIAFYQRVRRGLNREMYGETEGEPISPYDRPPLGPDEAPMPKRKGVPGAAKKLVERLEQAAENIAVAIVKKTKQIAKLEQQYEKNVETVFRYKVTDMYVRGMSIADIIAQSGLPEERIVAILDPKKNKLVALFNRGQKAVAAAEAMRAELGVGLRMLSVDDIRSEAARSNMEAEYQRLTEEVESIRAEMLTEQDRLQKEAMDASMQAEQTIDGIGQADEELGDLEDQYEDAGKDPEDIFDDPEILERAAEPLSDGGRQVLENEREGLLKRVEELRAEEARLRGEPEAPEPTEAPAMTREAFEGRLNEEVKAGRLSGAVVNKIMALFNEEPYKPATPKKSTSLRNKGAFARAKDAMRRLMVNVGPGGTLWWSDGYVLVRVDDTPLLATIDSTGQWANVANNITDTKVAGFTNQGGEVPNFTQLVENSAKTATKKFTVSYQIGDVIIGTLPDGELVAFNKEYFQGFDDGSVEFFGSDPNKGFVVKRNGEIIGLLMPQPIQALGVTDAFPSDSQVIDLIRNTKAFVIDLPNKALSKVKQIVEPPKTTAVPKTVSSVTRLKAVQGDIGASEARLSQIDAELAADDQARLAPVDEVPRGPLPEDFVYEPPSEARLARAADPSLIMNKLDDVRDALNEANINPDAAFAVENIAVDARRINIGIRKPAKNAKGQPLKKGGSSFSFSIFVPVNVDVAQVIDVIDAMEKTVLNQRASDELMSRDYGLLGPVHLPNTSAMGNYGLKHDPKALPIPVEEITQAIDALRQELTRAAGEQPVPAPGLTGPRVEAAPINVNMFAEGGEYMIYAYNELMEIVNDPAALEMMPFAEDQVALLDRLFVDEEAPFTDQINLAELSDQELQLLENFTSRVVGMIRIDETAIAEGGEPFYSEFATSAEEALPQLEEFRQQIKAAQSRETPTAVVQRVETVRPDSKIDNPAVRDAAYTSDFIDSLSARLSAKMDEAKNVQDRMQAFNEYLEAAFKAVEMIAEAQIKASTRLIRAERAQAGRLVRLDKREKELERLLEDQEKVAAGLERAQEYPDFDLVMGRLTGNIPLDVALDIDIPPYGVDTPEGILETVGPIYIPTGRTPKQSGRMQLREVRPGTEGWRDLTSAHYRDGDRHTIFNIREVAIRLGNDAAQMARNETWRALLATFAKKASDFLPEEVAVAIYEAAYQQALQYDPERIRFENVDLFDEMAELGLVEVNNGVGAYAPGNVNPQAVFSMMVKELYGKAIREEMEFRGFQIVDPYSNIDATVPDTAITHESMFVPGGFKETAKRIVEPTGSRWTDRTIDIANRITQGFKTGTLVLSVTWQLGDIISSLIIAQMTGVNVTTMIARMKQVVDAEYNGGYDRSMWDPNAELPTPTRLGRTLQESPVQDLSLAQAERERIMGLKPIERPQPNLLMRPFRKVADISYRVNETINRVSRHAYYLELLETELARRNINLDQVIEDRSLLNDPELRQIFFDTAETANKWLGDFANLDSSERRYITPLIPFYSWTKHIHKVFMALGKEHPQSIRWYLTIGAMYYNPEEDPMNLRTGLRVMGGYASTGFLNPLGDVLAGPLARVATGQGFGGIGQTLGPVPRMVAGIAGYDVSGASLINRPVGTGVYSGTGTMAYGGTLASPQDFLGFTIQQFPIAQRTLSALPALNLALPGEPIPENIPGTRIALGPVARYQTGEARTKPGFGQQRIEQPGGELAAVGRLFSLPFIPYRSEQQIRDIELSARQRLRTLESIRRQRDILGPP